MNYIEFKQTHILFISLLIFKKNLYKKCCLRFYLCISYVKNFKVFNMLEIFNFLLLFLIQNLSISNCKLSQQESFVENKVAYQQGTRQDAYKANQITHGSSTFSHDEADGYWVLVDFDGYYQIEEVCLLNNYGSEFFLNEYIKFTYI